MVTALNAYKGTTSLNLFRDYRTGWLDLKSQLVSFDVVFCYVWLINAIDVSCTKVPIQR